MPLFLGLDTGTSGTKAVLTDESGALLATHTRPYELSTPQPQWAEQHPESDWWDAACEAIAAVLSHAGISGDQVGAVGLTGQMHGSVFLDANHRVLRPALLWCDARTGEECVEITEAIGGPDALYATIGQPVFTSFTAPKILWLRKHEPENFEKVAHVLLPKDFIRLKLTGEFATDVSDASGTSLLDVRARRWSDAMLAALRLPAEWFPAVFESVEVTGTVTREAAMITGLKEGTPVVAGGGDQAAGAVGCGIVENGAVSLSLGTSGVLFAHLDQPFFAPEAIQTFCHAVPGKWHMMGCVISAAGSFEWYRDTFAPAEPYESITARAASAPAGCEGLIFLPYLAGERNPYFDPEARAVLFGATRRTDNDFVARAVLEGVAYGFRDLFGRLKETGTEVGEVRAIGGGIKSPLWRQILADVTGKTLCRMNIEEGPAFGAALLAAVGTGTFASVPEACAATLRTVDSTIPDRSVGPVYDGYYAIYRQLYPLLKDAFHAVAERSRS
ncbi:MAG: xylulokinase [Capsulimonadales bacterium]|nr:xylulokinase [Capsulimonadales bacterium]